MGERPVSDAVEGLSRLPREAEHELGTVADDVRAQTTQLSGTLRSAGRDRDLSAAADESDALSAEMQSLLADLPDQVSGIVQDEIGALRQLAAPDTAGTTTEPGAAGAAGLGDLPVFGPPDTDPVGVHGSAADTAAEAVSPGTPRLEPATRRPRHQAAIGRQGRPTDVGFHLLGHAPGGPTTPLNVVPGNGTRLEDGLANLDQGAYAMTERSVRAALEDDLQVGLEIRPVCRPRNLSRRPDEFHVRVVIDGEPEDFVFINK